MHDDVVTVTAGAEQFTCNAYFVPGDTPTLVDAGTMPGVADVVAEHTAALDRVVLTHQHSDHVGRLDEVLDAFDADLFAYGDHPRRSHELDDGDTVVMGDETYDVVYTPGHANDHVSLLSETRLFSGDVVVYNDGAFDDGSFGRTDMAGQSRERLIQSLGTILDRLPDSVVSMYAGHGDVFHAADHDDSVRDVIERALSRAERRQPKYPDG
jgi:glyoxylase-like metal-dependent hydrolase (beta-lactamase superfamily II)